MINLKSLFVEFNCISIAQLLQAINNRIDWYDEMLYDDPWNTFAKVSRDHYSKLYNEIKSLYHTGADNDIDQHSQKCITSH